MKLHETTIVLVMVLPFTEGTAHSERIYGHKYLVCSKCAKHIPFLEFHKLF